MKKNNSRLFPTNGHKMPVRDKTEFFKLMKWFNSIEAQNDVIKDWIKRSVRSGDIKKAKIGRRRLKTNIEKMRQIVGLLNKQK